MEKERKNKDQILVKLKTVEKINETKANKNKINKLLYGTKKKGKERRHKLPTLGMKDPNRC